MSIPMPMPSVAPAATALREATVQPRLVEMVEPAVPQRVLDDIGRAVELNVDITIRADGSVASVAVLQPAPRTLIRYVVAAIERWRFEPLPGGLVHRVQVLFNER
jgi:TonB family protein